MKENSNTDTKTETKESGKETLPDRKSIRLKREAAALRKNLLRRKAKPKKK
ncbi:hypothetical protein [Candidatus Nucleicultrix amoebiphila]|jgi:hypothetical protein|uniref:hypothetical protein n=1 Tax=Candidatus Nucleicultrix amoebiphila TaxID=1509244 RepID=UPI0012F4F978|nr:hypothetical protein [Candidatus Nucleicultrix amoebiphila]